MHSVFTAALFTTVKIWKQPKCPSTNEWIKKLWNIYIYIKYIYTIGYYSTIEKQNFVICSNMYGLGGHYAK